MKRFLKIVRNVLLILLIVGVSGYFAIQHPAVQTWLTNRATAWLSSELNTTVSVGSVDIDLWARIVLNDVYVQDLHGDSLMFIASMHVGAHQLDRQNKVLEINSPLKCTLKCTKREKTRGGTGVPAALVH